MTMKCQLNQMPTKKLCELWAEIDKKPISGEVATVRGWVMDALERRNPEAFDKWLEDDDGNPPEVYFLN